MAPEYSACQTHRAKVVDYQILRVPVTADSISGNLTSSTGTGSQWQDHDVDVILVGDTAGPAAQSQGQS